MSTKPKELFPGHFKVQWYETMHMLDLSANQIDLTVQEGTESVELLTETFTAMAACLEGLEKSIKRLDGRDRPGEADQALRDCQITREKVSQAIIGLQFYDRLTQRLHHIRESLAVLSALIDDPEKQNVPEEWVELRDKIKSRYSIEHQKTIFHALMQGADIDEVFEFFDEP